MVRDKVEHESDRLRICVACRAMHPRSSMLKLTVDHQTMEVTVCGPPSAISNKAPQGRSAYICKAKRCFDQALKGSRLKAALEGRKIKGVPNRRSVRWPLEPQLIQDMSRTCTDGCQTCKNTQETEGGE